METKIKDFLCRMAFFAAEGMGEDKLVEFAKQADALLNEINHAKPGKVPDGWRFFTADFSLQAAGKSETGSVMLIRDHAGKARWHAFSDEVQELVPLYVSGNGRTVDEAISDAACVAIVADTFAANLGDRVQVQAELVKGGA